MPRLLRWVPALVFAGIGTWLFRHRHAIHGWMERGRLQWWEGISLCGPFTGGPSGCIDYNGPWGNDDPKARGWQHLINFLGSDCCIALLQGYCWDEFLTHTPCYQNHGGKSCSELIGRHRTASRSGRSTTDTLRMPPPRLLQPPPTAH